MYWFNTTRKQAKEFLFFSSFHSVTSPTLLFCLSFSYIRNKRNDNKREYLGHSFFFDYEKYFCFSVTVSFSPTHYYVLLSFLCTQLEGNYKSEKINDKDFSSNDYNTSKTIFAFLCLSLFRPVSFMFCHSWSLLKGNREAIKSIAFLAKPIGIFFTYPS